MNPPESTQVNFLLLKASQNPVGSGFSLAWRRAVDIFLKMEELLTRLSVFA